MSLFEAGKEYYLEVGPVESSRPMRVRVISVEDNWIKIDGDGGVEMFNTASPLIISAKECVELPADSIYRTRVFFPDED